MALKMPGKHRWPLGAPSGPNLWIRQQVLQVLNHVTPRMRGSSQVPKDPLPRGVGHPTPPLTRGSALSATERAVWGSPQSHGALLPPD